MFNRSRNFRVFYCIVGLIILFSSFAVASAQETQENSEEKPCDELKDMKDFFVIDQFRTRLLKEIPELEAKRKELMEDKIPQFTKATKDLDAINQKIESLKAKATLTEADKQQLNDWVNSKAVLENAIGGRTVESLQKELTEAENDLSWKQAQLKCANTKVSGYSATPDQDFKKTMSIMFAVLIAIVIIGFFITALWDEKVRQAVFAGQVGLQFIALFSIVIAIILFGITAVLEAKELSALLGSIAGYILGRTMSNRGGSDGGDSGGDFAGKVASLRVNPPSVTLDATKRTEKLTVTLLDAAGKPLTPPAGTPNPNWKTSDASVATVDAVGTVTRVSPGTATVTADFNGKTANCAVTCN